MPNECLLTLAVLACFSGSISAHKRDRGQTTSNHIDSAYSGQAAIDLLHGKSASGSPIESLSKAWRKSKTEIEGHFMHDHTLRLDMSSGNPQRSVPNMFYADEAPDPAMIATRSLPDLNTVHDDVDVKRVSTLAATALTLHSRRGASKTIFLDFDGHNITNTAWNSASVPNIIAPAFSTDADASTFSASELSIITAVWQRVSEDYAPFDIDVTTEYAGSENFLTRSSTADSVYGVRVLISPISAQICSTCGGLSYVNVFDYIGECLGPSFSKILAHASENKT
jgi:hypothetical protein